MTSPVKKIASAIAFSVKNRLMSIRMQSNSFVLYVPHDEKSDLPQVVIQFAKNAARNQRFAINLSYMTGEELALFEEFMMLAIDIARPLSKELDSFVEKNREVLSDDFNSRVYRTVPTVVLGKGALEEYSARLFGGRSDVLQRAGFRFRDDQGLLRTGSGVAPEIKKDTGGNNAESSDGIDEGVREILLDGSDSD